MEEKDLFEKLVGQQVGNYTFRNPNLLKQAFKRRSYTEENGGENNEVLEFIGDKAIDIAVVRYLTNKYGNAPAKEELRQKEWLGEKYEDEFSCELKEGQLTQLKQRLVQKDTLARRIDELAFADFLIMGRGDVLNNRSQEKSVKEDLFEAIIGAIAIDSNWDFEKIQDAVELMLNPDSILSSDGEIDYVSLIYEWDALFGCVPWFKYSDRGYSEGMLLTHPDAIFQFDNLTNRGPNVKTCFVKIRRDIPEFAGFGTSKNEARKAACKLAYEYIKKHDMLFTIRDEIEEPTLEMSINQLEILARRGYFSLPKYVAEESHDKNGNPIWKVTCSIEEFDVSYTIESSSKKSAKKEAAFEMLKYVLDNYEEE
ncbi:ribonuclease III domain-containing protein [Pseudobutyrivibrio sp.]